MQKLTRESIILSVLLRCWLKKKWIHAIYLTVIRKISITDTNNLSSIDLIVQIYARMIRSNCVVMSETIIAVDWDNMMRLILQDHRELQMLQEVAVMTFLKTSLTRAAFRSLSFFMRRSKSLKSISAQIFRRSIALFDNDNHVAISKKEQKYENLQKRFNVHIKSHLQKIAQKYETTSNCNVLINEDKHKWVYFYQSYIQHSF